MQLSTFCTIFQKLVFKKLEPITFENFVLILRKNFAPPVVVQAVSKAQKGDGRGGRKKQKGNPPPFNIFPSFFTPTAIRLHKAEQFEPQCKYGDEDRKR